MINGKELWVTDGTAGSTNLVKDIFYGAGSILVKEVTPIPCFSDR